jgi:predicted GNAT superfamily acetyltransferase
MRTSGKGTQTAPMTTAVDRLTTLDDLLACEKLQQTLFGDRARSVLTVPLLAAIQRAGGLLLAAWGGEGRERSLCGALVDLVAEVDGYPARFTAFLGVRPDSVNQGIAQSLRAAERAIHAKAGVDLVYWWSDPLSSGESHIAFNKLAAISTAHCRNALGPLDDRANAGTATDRVLVEWWIDAPRVSAVLDEGRLPPHYGLGLDQMQVVTQTKGTPSGLRKFVGFDESPSRPVVLAEVPVNVQRIREEDAPGAKAWRIGTRETLELLFSRGYTIVGFVHEGGRSFHLLEHADRGSILGAS